MPYPERKPIYDAYKQIISEIINSQKYKEYAVSEIEALDESLLGAFKEIRKEMIINKNWSS